MLLSLVCALLTQPQSAPVFEGGLTVVSTSVFGPIADQRKLIRIDPVVNSLVQNSSLDSLQWSPREEYPKTLEPSKFAGGYMRVQMKSPRNQVLLMSPLGAGMFYVNGEPHIGDVYGYGNFLVPVKLRFGVNEVIIQCARPLTELKVKKPADSLVIDLEDATLPSVGPNVPKPGPAAVIIKNCEDKRIFEKILYLDDKGVKKEIEADLYPLTVQKLKFNINPDASWFELKVAKSKSKPVRFQLHKPGPNESYLVTFRSDFDSSVQMYGVRPSSSPPNSSSGIVLSLHGASVTPMNQANAYGSKPDLTIICPTNRRPYGFNWEDLGRRDAMEVLEHSKKLFAHDPRRIYLTGHSMGGHGTWHVAGQHPGFFAAAVPCAGWETFQTYTGGPNYLENETDQALKRAAIASDVPAFVDNYASLDKIFIVHGGADETVPLREAQSMYKKVRDIVPTTLHVEPGQGHWYDTDPEPGANCVDFAPAFATFKTARLKSDNEVNKVKFVTADLGIQQSLYWVKLLRQSSTFRLTKFSGEFKKDRVDCVTENLEAFELTGFTGARTLKSVQIDEQTLIIAPNSPMQFKRDANRRWSQVPQPEKSIPMPHGFKSVWNNRMLLVIGTGGTKEEKAWMIAKARFDLEQKWYRGNATPTLVSDTSVSTLNSSSPNMMIYGSPSSNSAFKHVLTNSEFAKLVQRPGQVFAGIVTRGGTQISFVGGSELKGMKASERLPLFGPGVGVPDLIIGKPEIWSVGNGAVLESRFWNPNWTNLE